MSENCKIRAVTFHEVPCSHASNTQLYRRNKYVYSSIWNTVLIRDANLFPYENCSRRFIPFVCHIVAKLISTLFGPITGGSTSWLTPKDLRALLGLYFTRSLMYSVILLLTDLYTLFEVVKNSFSYSLDVAAEFRCESIKTLRFLTCFKTKNIF